ncbi:adenosylcobinamide-GDP ribazoletransferase [Plantactinospora mayteni]|uniref:Adenosylcobinamide-GDP ribazoletransferase n=1 Tax=Plantactinospora mayteni TaxID=566021 RepID=A0ABQ4ELJ4_9ACTN|nr:adenosylcobinamide-GDP ribazoletransferase [Plantactinospora mayteni]GIG95616.1 adenosylcobinamide-GDP ribazoletransferase [Plantactinospora mayteni]
MSEGRFAAGGRLALTTFTVAPLRAGRVDRASAGTAMTLAPLVGALLGLLLAGVLGGLGAIAPPLVAGGVTVAVAALLTRGLHLDGLADTVDALGSYRSGDEALRIMRQPDVGPFGVTALLLVLLLQAASFAALAARPWTALAAGAATGRLAVSWACRRGVPAARPEGLGALVAGTVGPAALVGLSAGVALLAVPAVPGRPWQGPLAVAVALAGTLLLVRHVVRRLGGITGDVLGAVVELGSTLFYLGVVLTG